MTQELFVLSLIHIWLSADDKRTCALNDMNCRAGQPEQTASLQDMNAANEQPDMACSITNMNCRKD